MFTIIVDMKLGISINEVLRDFLGQLTYTYTKYINDSSIKEGDVTSLNLIEFYPFNSVVEMNRFIYSEAALEIFGHADLVSENLMNHFNHMVMDIRDDGDHDIELVSREVDKSISATHFFLSKTGCRADKIRFVNNNEDEWDGIDILVTANPIALANKPNNKISVKIKASYNADVSADYELDSLLEFIKDGNLREKILNTKITTYE